MSIADLIKLQKQKKESTPKGKLQIVYLYGGGKMIINTATNRTATMEELLTLEMADTCQDFQQENV